MSPDDESVIWGDKEEHRARVSEMLDGRLRRALVVAVEENNDGLSTIDIAERGVVVTKYYQSSDCPYSSQHRGDGYEQLGLYTSNYNFIVVRDTRYSTRREWNGWSNVVIYMDNTLCFGTCKAMP